MLQDTAHGGAALAHERQRDLRRTAAGPARRTRMRRAPGPIRLRPANQPSIITAPSAAQLRRQWSPIS